MKIQRDIGRGEPVVGGGSWHMKLQKFTQRLTIGFELLCLWIKRTSIKDHSVLGKVLFHTAIDLRFQAQMDADAWSGNW